jgi:predicted TIM-barrel fold metal-dependent hydrolase
MPDDPVFEPILQFITDRTRTLFAHLAEPAAAWQPLDSSSPHYDYYKNYPAWHMFLHPERPAKQVILAARDRLLAQHPRLKIVGCHLGSMEGDVDEIAQRFEAYPNFAVDTAARIADLMLQPRARVRAFLIKHQDRVLYGTDLSFMPWDRAEATIQHMENTYARDWKYFATAEIVRYKDRDIQGLALPRDVLRKLYQENALRWIPGLLNRPGEGAAL